MKKNRSLKVYSATEQRGNQRIMNGSYYVEVPQIRMQGNWLRECGFDSGTRLDVQCEEGKLTVRTVFD